MADPTHQNISVELRLARLEADLQLLKGACYQLFANDVLLVDRVNDLLFFLKYAQSMDILMGQAKKFDELHYDLRPVQGMAGRLHMTPPDLKSGVIVRD
jgi:hypothetical protein